MYRSFERRKLRRNRVLRLWDAVGGFLFLFSHMQDKLSKHSSQVYLLKELLNLQKDMITMMLSMLEGKVFARIMYS